MKWVEQGECDVSQCSAVSYSNISSAHEIIPIQSTNEINDPYQLANKYG